jgi:hypothetical protein
MAPLDFETNPDAIALRSALSVLQIQKRRAEEDLHRLERAKAEALEQPEAFVADLVAGKVNVAQLNAGGSLGGGLGAGGDDDDDEEDSSDGDDGADGARDDNDSTMNGTNNVPPPSRKPKQPPRPAWQSLPGPQTIVRTPAINWAQYGVLGESLDRLHADQVARPSVGAPATIAPSSTGPAEFRFDFTAGGGGGSGGAGGGPDARMEFVGVAAPYAPLRDKIGNRPFISASNHNAGVGPPIVPGGGGGGGGGMQTRRRGSTIDGVSRMPPS